MRDDLELKQDKRIALLKTPLGEDVLVLTRFEGVEGLSELFEYQIDALSKRPNLNFDSAIGEKCSVTFKIHNVREKRERHFSGVLAQAQWLGGGDAKTYAYRLWLRPSLWLLSQKAECRIFHSMTAPEIIKKLLEEHGIAFEDNFSENHPTREYCVQYRETDLAFLSRLMEEEGIYYFFKHSPGEHKLFLVELDVEARADRGGGNPSVHRPCRARSARTRAHLRMAQREALPHCESGPRRLRSEEVEHGSLCR
jgi:type VI secretion system secreted protein VgrG